MMVVDTSALVAILFAESDADLYLSAMSTARRLIIGAPSVIELRSVLRHKLGPNHMSDADDLLGLPAVSIAPWTADHIPVATDALRRFGGRPAKLNFGDCMVYAIARLLDAPLLYKGEDFARTDIRSAI